MVFLGSPSAQLRCGSTAEQHLGFKEVPCGDSCHSTVTCSGIPHGSKSRR